jgi:hypothetical protein
LVPKTLHIRPQFCAELYLRQGYPNCN